MIAVTVLETIRRHKVFIVIACFIIALTGQSIVVSRLPHSAKDMLHKHGYGMQVNWLRVVDQDGNSIPHYKLRLVETRAFQIPFTMTRERVEIYETDATGNCCIVSRGSRGFARLFDNSYQIYENPGYLCWDKVLFRNDGVRVAPGYHHQSDYAGTKENPAILRVVRTGGANKLLYWKHHVVLPKQSSFWCMNVLTGEMWASDSKAGDICMTSLPQELSKYPNMYKTDSPRSREDWAAFQRYYEERTRIYAGQNCEVVPVVDEWGIWAPEEDWGREFHYPKDWSERNARSGKLQFYLRLQGRPGEPPIYGRVEVTHVNNERENNWAQYECYINTTGSRSLFYDNYIDRRNDRPCYGEIRVYASPMAQH